MFFWASKKWVLQRRNSDFFQSLELLSKSDRKKIYLVSLIQIFLGSLDLIGISLVGILGALTINGVQSKAPGTRVLSFLELIGIQNFKFQEQAAIIGILATLILISRTFISIFFTRKTLHFLSRRGASISSKLISKLLAQSLTDLNNKSTQEKLYAVTSGVSSISLGVIGSSVSLISDVSLLAILTLGLFIVDPVLALSTSTMYGILGFVLFINLQAKAKKLGNSESKLNIKSNEKISEILYIYRELLVRDRRKYYADLIGNTRLELARTLAEITFLPNISKYVIETSVILGALAVSAVQFLTRDASHAVATLSIFLAAGTRIAPAVLRVQQGAITIKGSLGAAKPTLDLIESLNNEELPKTYRNLDFKHTDFNPQIEIKNLQFRYPNNLNFELNISELRIYPGEFVAFVGPSGSGKTTVVDLMLGLLKPQFGEILISGFSPLESIGRWPGSIAYVPQEVRIITGTIIENIGIGFPKEEIFIDKVLSSIKAVDLEEFVENSVNQLDTFLGEGGAQISGGQKQRLGIARALYTQPRILFLDEATSSLDSITENNIQNMMEKLHGEVTTIVVAHRLSTVRNADKVIYMEQGKIIAIGNFEEVRRSVKNFDRQASLMGL